MTPTTIDRRGVELTYEFTVFNTGNVTLSNVAIEDDLDGLSAIDCPAAEVSPAGTLTCTATRMSTQDDVDAGSVVNRATLTIDGPDGQPMTPATSTATVSATAAPRLTLAKRATPVEVSAVGQRVDYEFEVTNTGNLTIDSISVSDPMVGLSAVACPEASLAPAGSMTCTASRLTTQRDLDSGSVVNIARVGGVDARGNAVEPATAAATVTATQTPELTLTKSAAPASVERSGVSVAYTFVVRNAGNVTVQSLRVEDPLEGLTPISCPRDVLAPGAEMTCTANRTVTQADVDSGSIVNSAPVNVAYVDMFRRARGLMDGPETTELTRLELNARTHMLLSEIFWAPVWLHRHDPEDYGRVTRRLLSITADGLAAPGAAWNPRPLPDLIPEPPEGGGFPANCSCGRPPS